MVRNRLTLAAFAFLAAGLATPALAEGRHRVSKAPAAYRLQLRGNTTVLSKDQPVRRGSVVLFHRYPDGRLTGIPIEDVAFVATSVDRPLRGGAPMPVAAGGAIALQPGDAVLLGPTGAGAPSAYPNAPAGAAAAGMTAPAPPSPSGEIPARLAVEAQVFPGDLPAQTGQTGSGAPAMVNGAPVYGTNGAGTTVLNPTLQRTVPASAVSTTATSPTTPVAPNGFPATTAAAPINPNGFPATTTTGPQSGAQPIDANGFPSMTGTTTAPATSAQPAQPAQSTQPAQPAASPQATSAKH
jgi:hypothetical protein